MGILQNTHNYLVPAAGTTRAYRETQTFRPDSPVTVDFRDMALDGLSFVPSGVLVDNTRGAGDLAIVINEFSWRIVVPAGKFVHMPYPAPYNQTATITGDGLATVVFVDYPVIPWTDTSSGGSSVAGVLEIIPGDNVTVDNTDPQKPIISATGGGGGGGESNIVGQVRGVMRIQNISTAGVAGNIISMISDPDGIWDAVNKKANIPNGAASFDVQIGIMAMNNTLDVLFEISGTPWLDIPANQTSASTYFGGVTSALSGGLDFSARLKETNEPTGMLQVMVCITFYSN